MSSPQGKFSDSAALLDGHTLTATDAHGKHLFLGFGDTGWVHIHLGLFGKLGFGAARPRPPPRPSASAWSTPATTRICAAPPPAP